MMGNCYISSLCSWGISSNGRAPALHAGSTGIDARILQFSYCLILNDLH